MALVTFKALRDYLDKNRAVRRRMRDRPSERVLEDLEILLRLYDEEIKRLRDEYVSRKRTPPAPESQN